MKRLIKIVTGMFVFAVFITNVQFSSNHQTTDNSIPSIQAPSAKAGMRCRWLPEFTIENGYAAICMRNGDGNLCTCP